MTRLRDLPLDARIVLARHQLRIRELLQLERGAVVPLGGDGETLSELHVNGVAVALGLPAIVGERTLFTVHQPAAKS